MGTTLNSATLETRLLWEYMSDGDLANGYDINTVLRNSNRNFTNGGGDNQLNTVWHDRRLITPSTATDDLDLAGGLTDMFGNVLTFTSIKSLYIENRGIRSGDDYVPTEGCDLLVGGAGDPANAWAALTDGSQDAKILVRSGGVLFVSAPLMGYSVIAASLDILRIALAGGVTNDIWYDIVICGVR